MAGILLALAACDESEAPGLEIRLRVDGTMAQGAPDVVSTRRGAAVVVEAVGASHLWAFHGDDLALRCPGSTCERRGDGWIVTVRLGDVGRYRFIGVGCAAAIEPEPGFERSVAAARRCGDVELRSIDVGPRP